ncbi:Tat pathway signal sequence domain protein [Kitasatospora sp. NPDC088346]|uniref:Tat pathway signal sequence domain protein n=1 Tax=Kitasatospora sp. NPDC088346 TaxID=3364073 RepID=UPI00380D1D0A
MSGTGRERGAGPPAGRGSLGPVEAARGTVEAGPTGHRPTHRRPHPADLTRRQKYALATLLLAAATLPATGHAGSRPEQAANSPPPYPAQITHFRYAGTGPAAVAGGDGFALRVTVRNDGPGPVELVAVRQSYRGVEVTAPGALPRRLDPGVTAVVEVVFRVTDCAQAPPDAGMPFLDVTLRNTRAIQTLSQILGDAYAGDLSRNLHIACPDSDNRTGMPVPPFPDVVVR